MLNDNKKIPYLGIPDDDFYYDGVPVSHDGVDDSAAIDVKWIDTIHDWPSNDNFV